MNKLELIFSIALLKQNHSVDTSDDDKDEAADDTTDFIKYSINDKILKNLHSSDISDQGKD